MCRRSVQDLSPSPSTLPPGSAGTPCRPPYGRALDRIRAGRTVEYAGAGLGCAPRSAEVRRGAGPCASVVEPKDASAPAPRRRRRWPAEACATALASGPSSFESASSSTSVSASESAIRVRRPDPTSPHCEVPVLTSRLPALRPAPPPQDRIPCRPAAGFAPRESCSWTRPRRPGSPRPTPAARFTGWRGCRPGQNRSEGAGGGPSAVPTGQNVPAGDQGGRSSARRTPPSFLAGPDRRPMPPFCSWGFAFRIFWDRLEVGQRRRAGRGSNQALPLRHSESESARPSPSPTAGILPRSAGKARAQAHLLCHSCSNHLFVVLWRTGRMESKFIDASSYKDAC